ncbi:hypothetical protein G6F35_017514 [Rhizopus arrhizus]|nr:hypothetical protein G6F35_017514 [Rhizopus arrhizus]
MLQGGLHVAVDVFAPADVGMAVGVAAGGKRVLVHVAQVDAGAAVGKGVGQGRADACRAGGDDDAAAAQVHRQGGFHQAAGGFLRRRVDLIAGNLRDQLVVVPRPLGF